MSGLILPGGGPVPAEEKSPKDEYESLTEEQKAALDELADKENPEDLFEEVEFAFVVVKQKDGSFGISNDLKLPVVPKRSADENDYVSAFAVIAGNIQATQTANLVQHGLRQQAAAMQQQMQEQQLRQRLNLG